MSSVDSVVIADIKMSLIAEMELTYHEAGASSVPALQNRGEGAGPSSLSQMSSPSGQCRPSKVDQVWVMAFAPRVDAETEGGALSANLLACCSVLVGNDHWASYGPSGWLCRRN